MSMKSNDRILYQPSRGTPDQPIAWCRDHGAQRMDQVESLIREYYRSAPIAGVDASILTAQAAHETGGFTSSWWTGRLNPAGIGITGDPVQNAASHVWTSGVEAARSHMAHLVLYASGKSPEGWFDPRAAAYHEAYDSAVMARTIADLAGTWAKDTDYAAGVVKWSGILFDSLLDQTVLGGSEMELVFGQVKHPPFVDRLIPDAETGAWNDLGHREPYGVCQHSMIGTLLGTDSWFRRGSASNGLTDYGIGGDSDGPSYDGVIYRWNDPLGKSHSGISRDRAGWANGGSDGLEGDGPLFVRTFGIDAINRNLVSIERSDGGDTNHPVSPKQFTGIVSLTAHWFDYAKVPYTKYPLNPRFGVVTHLLHLEFATKDCPFPPVYNRIDEIQDAVRGLLKAGQTHTEGDPIPPVEPPSPDHDAYPNGWSAEDLKKRFGRLKRHLKDGKVKTQGFNPKGPISNAWVSRAASEGIKKVDEVPKPLGWWDLDADKDQQAAIIVFDRYWTLYRPTATTAWRWVR